MPALRYDIDHRIIAFANTVDGIVTFGELWALGVRERTLRRLLASGWLRLVARGIYAVGSGEVTDRGRMRIVMLATGTSSYVSCEGAMFLAGALSWAPRIPTIVTTSSIQSREGVVLLRTSSLPEGDRVDDGSIRRTSLERAIVDMSPTVDPLRLLKHMRQAEHIHRFSIERAVEVVSRLRNRGGCDNVRRALLWLEMGDGGADSSLEVRFHRLATGNGFREPRSNVHMAELLPTERVDFLWPDERLVVEVDGPHHLNPMVAADDVRRDEALRAAGWRVLRFWWWEIEEFPADVLRRLGAAMA